MMCEKCKREMNQSSSHSMTEEVITLRMVMQAMFETYGVTQRQLRNRRRNSGSVESRAMFCKLASEFTNCSLTKIGQYIDRDHTTVLYLVNTKALSSAYQALYKLARANLKEFGAMPIYA